MINIKDKSKCCGCSACASICPQKCIQMKPDEEGFLYPTIDDTKCISCNLCTNTCPTINVSSIEKGLNGIQSGYAVQNKDKDVLRESTSGGFFTALAQYVIKKDGVVFGAMYDDRFRIIHGPVKTLEELSKFRNSKYTQSDIGSSFESCKKELENNNLVCFSGTPCQIAGLKSYLGRDYENLITVDLICRGVSSPLLFEKYIEWNGGIEEIKDIKFRDKFYGYYSSLMSIYKKNGDVIRRVTDPLLEFYFSNLSSRPSCYNCHFKTKDRVSDFTIFDCWHAVSYSKDFRKKVGGATAVLVRNEKALKFFEGISRNIIFKEVSAEKMISNDGEMMKNSISWNSNRDRFFEDLKKGITISLLWEKYSDKTRINKFKRLVKRIMIKLRVFNFYMCNKY